MCQHYDLKDFVLYIKLFSPHNHSHYLKDGETEAFGGYRTGTI